ncbi:pyridoxamine 5'-phosphate oxidase family protein [Actinosynnema sp. NPDC023587]|uniref:pyridoxamine 5'-phosphate oxidase family protein n=1 Tax=Actinosynnema sp. NPDC023587 TaxID=3154695 RepID=UPI0033E4A418
MPVMSTAQREEFLAGVHVGVIGIARPAGPPLTVPVWYLYEPGGDVLVQTSPESVKFRLLDAAREFSLAVQVETPPYRYVSVSGPVVAIDPTTSRADLVTMANRYFDADAADDFVRQVENDTIATVRMRPQRWYSSDYS